MRGYFNRVCTFFLYMILAATTSHSVAAEQSITIAADEWCPVNCEENSNKQGIGIDLARKIFEPMGFKVNYVVMSWDKALDAVRKGEITAVVGAGRNDEKQLIFPDNPITNGGDDFFVRSGTPWRYQGIHTLKGKRIGIIEDYGYGDLITGFIKQYKYTTGVLDVARGKTPLDDNLAKLLEGKIDVLIENKTVMDYKLKQTNKIDKVVWAGNASRDPVYLAFSPALPQSKRLAALYDAAIRSMKTSGALKQMYTVYGLTP